MFDCIHPVDTRDWHRRGMILPYLRRNSISPTVDSRTVDYWIAEAGRLAGERAVIKTNGRIVGQAAGNISRHTPEQMGARSPYRTSNAAIAITKKKISHHPPPSAKLVNEEGNGDGLWSGHATFLSKRMIRATPQYILESFKSRHNILGLVLWDSR